MLSAFLNPLTFLVGGALVLTPIIIHLINRIRYRRVKWAAMEFLLKAQKKMRRKKILEQLLLLFLRCLLVFLAGVLFARFIGCDQTHSETRPTTHVVILDDTPSMADGWRTAEGVQTDAYTEAKRLVYERLMPAAAEATTTQTLHLIRLSDLDHPFPAGTKMVEGKEVTKTAEDIRGEARIQTKSIEAMEAYLKPLRPAIVHKSLIDGLVKAKELFDKRAAGDNSMVLHIVSDLRAIDWAKDGPTILEKVKDFKDNGVSVHLIDVGHPARKPDRKSPDYNDNVSIVELKPRNRVVSAGQQTEIEVAVKNFGKADLKDVKIDFYRNGRADLINTVQFQTLPANQEKRLSATAIFDQVGSKEKPLDRFNLVTAVLAMREQDGLAIDNSRHTVVEVRSDLAVLVVDGRTVENGVDLREQPEGDSYFLRALLLDPKPEAKMQIGNLRVENLLPAQLDKADLRQFSTIYLMNVPTLSEAAVANLEKFVRAGGGVGVFLGANVKPDDYNARMHRGGTGFFPIPLQREPSKELTPDQKTVRLLSFNARLMLRNPANRLHPAIKSMYTDDSGQISKEAIVERFFRLPIIDHHWPISGRRTWKDDRNVQELYCLQNETPIGEFEGRTTELVGEIKKRYNEPKFEKARKYLDPLLERIRRTPAETKPLSELARLLDELLCDQINYGDESEPVLREFWAQPEMAETKQQAMQLRDDTKYGDPLYVVKQYGLGRVAVMTTDAGGTYADKKQWTDWPSLSGAAGWLPIVVEMQKYLAGGGDEKNRSVGDRFFAEFDRELYDPTVKVEFLGADAARPNPDRTLTLDRKALDDLTMDAPAPVAGAPADAPPRPFQLTFPNAKVPGAYLFTLTRKKAGEPDFVGIPFNVDAAVEGDLRRESTDELEKHTNKLPLHNTEERGWIDALKQKPSDMSSGRWLYLLILLVLIAEQAWAVRISYHTRPEDLEMLAPSAAAAYAHHSTPTPASAGERAETGTAET